MSTNNIFKSTANRVHSNPELREWREMRDHKARTDSYNFDFSGKTEKSSATSTEKLAAVSNTIATVGAAAMSIFSMVPQNIKNNTTNLKLGEAETAEASVKAEEIKEEIANYNKTGKTRGLEKVVKQETACQNQAKAIATMTKPAQAAYDKANANKTTQQGVFDSANETFETAKTKEAAAEGLYKTAEINFTSAETALNTLKAQYSVSDEKGKAALQPAIDNAQKAYDEAKGIKETKKQEWDDAITKRKSAEETKNKEKAKLDETIKALNEADKALKEAQAQQKSAQTANTKWADAIKEARDILEKSGLIKKEESKENPITLGDAPSFEWNKQ